MDRLEPANYRDALAELVDRDALQSREIQRRQFDARREGVHPKLLEFEKRLLAKAAKIGVPLRCQFLDYVWTASMVDDQEVAPYRRGLAVCAVHGAKGFALSRKAWGIIGHLGDEVSRQGGLSLLWGGLDRPYHWEHREWRELQEGFPFERDGRFWK